MGQQNYEKKISKMFSFARVFAILTVLSAHITIKNSTFLSNYYALIGSIGVIAFLIISGYYFKRAPIGEFIKKKFKSIIVPWFFIGTIVYFINSILIKTNINIISYLLWMVGHNTYLYFVVVLITCFVLFYYHNNITLIIAMVLNIVSLVLTSQGILEPIIQRLSITNYLNVFNWIGFFSLGIIIKQIKPQKLYSFFEKIRFIVLPVSFTVVFIFALLNIRLGYFSLFGWLFELLCVCSIFSLCTFEKIYNKYFENISNMSYAIYLLHMLFMGVLNKLINVSLILSSFSNIIVLCVVYAIIFLGFLFSKLIRLSNIYTLLLGIRLKKSN